MTTRVGRRMRNLEVEAAEASSEAMAKLERQGLSLRTQPADPIPPVPESLSELGDGPLMELFASLTAWAGYLSGQLAVAEIDERAAESVLEAAEATAMVRDWGGTGADRVAVAKAQRQADPEVILRKQTAAERYAYRKLVGVLFTNVERDAALVSRELTRRTGSQESRPRRESRWRA